MQEVLSELSARGLTELPIGIDRAEAVVFFALRSLGLELVDAVPALENARAVKTTLELDIHRRNARLADRAIERFLQQMRPGMTENELWGALAKETFAYGALHAECRLLCSGPAPTPGCRRRPTGSPRTAIRSPSIPTSSARTATSPTSRAPTCAGEAPGSRELRDAYQAAYGFVHDAIPEFRAGRSFRDLGELLGERLPPEYRRLRYPFIAHGCGAADEYPVIVVEGNHEGELLPCMVLSVEGYMGRAGGKVGAKFEEQIIITDDALELISFAPLEPRPVVMDSPYLPLRPARRAPISPDRTHRARQPGRRHTRMPSLTAGPANSATVHKPTGSPPARASAWSHRAIRR